MREDNMSNKNILVTGATGQQGGSVLRALEGKGNELFALTRNGASAKARELSDRGIKVYEGNFHDSQSLVSAFLKVDSVFLVGSPFEAGTDDETQQGINAVDAAKKAGIKHLVYTSVANADKGTGIPHFDSKYKVEQHLRESGVPFTIIAPAFFYDNMMAPFILPGIQNGAYAQAMPPDVKLQMISAKNIGEFAALALQETERFAGKRIDIAGDALTGPQIGTAIGKASGRDIGYFEAPIEKVREMSEDMALMYEWFIRVGYDTDIAGLRNEFPEVPWETFNQWAKRQDWSVLDPVEAAN